MFSIVWPVDVAAAINAFAIESLDLVTVREAVGGVARRAGLPSCRKRRLRPGLESGTKSRAQRPYPDRRIGVKLYKTETMLIAPSISRHLSGTTGDMMKAGAVWQRRKPMRQARVASAHFKHRGAMMEIIRALDTLRRCRSRLRREWTSNDRSRCRCARCHQIWLPAAGSRSPMRQSSLRSRLPSRVLQVRGFI